MKFEDEEIYGLEASASGANATYLDYCDVAWHRPAYAACLKKIADRKTGRLDVRFAGCSAAIGRKACPAMKLQMEEAARGQAIYFINRAKLQAFNQYQQEMGAQAFASSVDGDNVRKARRPQKRQDTTDAVIKPQSEPVIAEGGDYAAAINAAMRKESQQPKAANDEVLANVPKPTSSGLSMLEMARMKLNGKG